MRFRSWTQGPQARALCLWGVILLLPACQSNGETQENPPPAPPPSHQESPEGEALEILRQSKSEVQIAIDQIRTGVSITGHVSGLAEDAVDEFKVMIYVHADHWRGGWSIHPAAAPGEGVSWASINRNLEWSIWTVKRDYTADQVAALLVPAAARPPKRVRALSEIPSRAWVVIRGTGQL